MYRSVLMRYVIYLDCVDDVYCVQDYSGVYCVQDYANDVCCVQDNANDMCCVQDYTDDVCCVQDSTPVMTKIYSTLGRKFNKKDLDEAMRMGEEMVSQPVGFCFINSCTRNLQLRLVNSANVIVPLAKFFQLVLLTNRDKDQYMAKCMQVR